MTEKITSDPGGAAQEASTGDVKTEGSGSLQKLVWTVDLDHTLVRTDTGVEGFLKWFWKNPLAALWATRLAYTRSLGAFKEAVCRNALVNVKVLPYREEVIEKVREAKAQGHRMILATASHELTAQAVVDHVGIFDEIIATQDRNIKGSAKAQAIEERIGPHTPYIYWGDSWADLQIWERSEEVGVINPSKKMLSQIQKLGQRSGSTKKLSVISDPPEPLVEALFKEIRVYQWIKGLLVFLPHVAAWGGALSHEAMLKSALAYFAVFGCGVSLDILDDFIDLENDRSDPHKSERPLASGALSTGKGLLLFAGFLLVGIGFSLYLPSYFLVGIAGFFMLGLLHRALSQRFFWLHAPLLAAGDVMRMVLGFFAVGMSFSYGFFVGFFFFFLLFERSYGWVTFRFLMRKR